jgi:hypothetical protein
MLKVTNMTEDSNSTDEDENEFRTWTEVLQETDFDLALDKEVAVQKVESEFSDLSSDLRSSL